MGAKESLESPLIEEGVYRAVFTHYETALMRMFGNAPKVFLHFRIVDPGPAFGVELYRGYRANGLKSKPGRYGTFLLGKRSELFLTLCRLTDKKLQRDRIALRAELEGRVLAVRVRTVMNDLKGRPLPRTLHYSTIDDIVRVEA